MSGFTTTLLLKTPTVAVHDMCCRGDGQHEHLDDVTHLVFPYRGIYVRHLANAAVVAEAGQVLFFNAGESDRISHPVPGGDRSLAVFVEEGMLGELAPKALRREGTGLVFRQRRLRIDARAQALVALLRHSLREKIAESLEAESLALTLVQRSLGPRTTHAVGASAGRQHLVDRTKLVLASDLSRRWALADIAAEVGVSPVYLTQVFQQVEGLPLYRYQLRLRLARALDLLAQYDDLSKLSLDLGFSSHSHFSAAFQRTYGRSPSEFRQSALQR
ncbi:AraC family transcriptional regulator [Dokdonella soli]|uniref:HTH araC/xylS-type domain-containing protein n=1 Tax=Dokdonella soli TaxID=529810 RepID=A0ABN1IB37_9GAMM